MIKNRFYLGTFTCGSSHFHLPLFHCDLLDFISLLKAQIKLREVIDDYIKEQIDKAGEAICMMVRKKISEDDVILTFG